MWCHPNTANNVMKHLTTAAAILAFLLAATTAWMLATHQTAMISASGLVKITAAAGLAAVGALIARWLLSLVEARDRRRWTVAAHPLNWLAPPLALAAALALWAGAHHFAARPSLHGNWSIGIYCSAGPEPTDFAPLGPQPALTADHVTDLPCGFVADPVLVLADGQFTLFYEAWNTDTDQGDICVSTSGDGMTWDYLGRVLDRVLLDGAPYRDTNLVQADDRWYLLTTTDTGSNLLVFHAGDPLGPWRPHAGNPVVQGDPDHARGGGSVIESGQGWQRFVQDVRPYYGNRVRAVTITSLSPEAYQQVPSGPEPMLVGHDDWNVLGMHTLWCVQRDDGRWLAAVDGHGRLIDTKPARWWR